MPATGFSGPNSPAAASSGSHIIVTNLYNSDNDLLFNTYYFHDVFDQIWFRIPWSTFFIFYFGVQSSMSNVYDVPILENPFYYSYHYYFYDGYFYGLDNCIIYIIIIFQWWL